MDGPKDLRGGPTKFPWVLIRVDSYFGPRGWGQETDEGRIRTEESVTMEVDRRTIKGGMPGNGSGHLKWRVHRGSRPGR